DIAQAAQDAGASWLTVHARTKVDGYKPPAYWEHVAPLRQRLKIPVIANGEVWTHEDYLRCQKISNCEHVMIGRGWIANPGIGLEIKDNMTKAPWIRWQNYFLDFFKLSTELRHEQYAIQRTKQLSKMMSQSYGEAHLLLQKIKTFQTAEPILEILRYKFNDSDVDKEIPAPKLIIASKFHKPSQEPYAKNSNLHKVLLPVL
ncbi:tRNA-dihydrouridine synthase family protein, partial [bacterium]|nr:tRNA-dihydrouridine synthase family protein [bacterium]